MTVERRFIATWTCNACKATVERSGTEGRHGSDDRPDTFSTISIDPVIEYFGSHGLKRKEYHVCADCRAGAIKALADYFAKVKRAGDAIEVVR